MSLLLNAITALPAERFYDDHMWDESGWMWLAGLMMMLLFAGGVALVVWLIVRSGHASTPRGGSARELLDSRYARGEIDSTEYAERRERLTGR